MDTGIIIAIIAGIGGTLSGLAAILSAILLNRKTMALLEYRIGQVEKKLDEHNSYAKRFEEIEKAMVAMQKDVSFLRERMEEK